MAIFDEKIEIRERCKGVHCVDLGESFPTRIYLQKSASIQPRTSPSKFGGKIQFNIYFTPYLQAFKDIHTVLHCLEAFAKYRQYFPRAHVVDVKSGEERKVSVEKI